MWAPHSTSPQSSSTIFFKRFLEILLWWTNEFRKLGEFKLLHIPLSSRINTPNYALYFPCPSRGRSLQSLRCDINVHYWVVWGDALGLYRHFCKSPGSGEEQSEWREKASPPGAELSCVPHILFSHPEYSTSIALPLHAVYTLQSTASYIEEDWSLWILPR